MFFHNNTFFVSLFQDKTNLEDLNFRQDSKICLMIALVVMAYVLSIQQGLENKVEKKKIYKNKPSRLVVSYFRQGLSIIKVSIALKMNHSKH